MGQIYQSKGRKNPRVNGSARILPNDRERVEEIQEGETDVFRKNNSLSFCSVSFLPRTAGVHLKGVGRGEGRSTGVKARLSPDESAFSFSGQACLTVSLCTSFFPGGSSVPEANSLLADPPYGAAKQG